MDIFNFCWLTLLDESKKCCVFFDKNTCNARNDIDENFNKPINRISYLYKFGSYNISFFHQCFMEFLTKAPDSFNIIDDFRSTKNLTICSMSTGPGTDIIGLLYSLHLINKPLINSTDFKIISRYGSWRNLVTEMLSSSIISVPDASTCKLIECDFLKDLSKKTQGYLKVADILLMCNSFSSSVIPVKVIHDTLKRVIQVLKPGALVFFISSKEKSAYFRELDSYGSFLFGPVEVTLENMPYNEKIIKIVGVKPLCSGKSLFAVWQKFHEPNFHNEIENTATNLHLSTKLVQNKSNVNSPILGMSNLKGEFSSNKNISLTDSIASSSEFFSCNISSQITEKKDEPFVSKNLNDFAGQTNFDTNISTKSVNTFDSGLRKKCVSPPCESGLKNEENNGNNIHYFMKTLDSLITKLEGYITSKESSKVFSDKKEQSCNHHQNMHEAQCRCSVKSCQFIENDATCHSEMCYIDTNVSNCNCSVSIVNNMHRVLPQEGPCIVIPLQNLSNESLAQILSIISQNTSSANKTASNLLPKKNKS